MTQTATSTYGEVLEKALSNFERIYSNRASYLPSAFYLLCEEVRMSLPDYDSAMATAVFHSMGNAIATKQKTGKYEEYFELIGIPADCWVDIDAYMKKIGCQSFLLPASTPHGMEYTGALCEAGWNPENYYSLEDEEMGFVGVVFSR